MTGDLLDAVDSEAASSGGSISFESLDDGTGLRIVDPIERRQYSIHTPSSVKPEPADVEQFMEPVDAAVRVTTDRIRLSQRETVYVRDESGAPVAHTYDTARTCPPGRYLIQVTTQVKLYLIVEAPVTVTPSPSATSINFDGQTEVVIGARSPHRHPNGTITTTDDIDQLRVAVSALSSALKTTSPERSFPTLRGHPPRLELGEEWARPEHLVAPETGVTLEVHRSIEDVLIAAPVAFYLGAELTWGDRRLRTDTGFVEPLAARHDFETGVERVLKQTFLLDCLTRTEGLYPVELDERRVFEARTDGQIDFQRLYDQSLSRRLETYLTVPYDTVADLVPAWSASTYIQPTPEAVTALPYLLDSLAAIRTTGPRRLEDEGPEPGVATADHRDTRSVETAHRPGDTGPHIVLPEPESAVTRVWVGDGIPIGASKAVDSGFEHRLDREPRTDAIRLQVVCNAPEMRDERDTVHSVYRARDDHQFEVDIRTDISTEELRAALKRGTDLFHYIGHVDRRGFRCRDGWLHAKECGQIGADMFLLNGCRSYGEGEHLIQQGAIAGIVSTTDLLNHRAAAIGRTIAVFLNYGFPLYAALNVVRETYRFGDAYALLGDAHAILFQPTTTFPEYVELQSRIGDTVTVAHRTFPSHRAGIGTDICPSYETGDRHYLFGGEIATVELSTEELASLLALPMPLRDGGDLRFSVTAEEGG